MPCTRAGSRGPPRPAIDPWAGGRTYIRAGRSVRRRVRGATLALLSYCHPPPLFVGWSGRRPWPRAPAHGLPAPVPCPRRQGTARYLPARNSMDSGACLVSPPVTAGEGWPSLLLTSSGRPARTQRTHACSGPRQHAVTASRAHGVRGNGNGRRPQPGRPAKGSIGRSASERATLILIPGAHERCHPQVGVAPALWPAEAQGSGVRLGERETSRAPVTRAPGSGFCHGTTTTTTWGGCRRARPSLPRCCCCCSSDGLGRPRTRGGRGTDAGSVGGSSACLSAWLAGWPGRPGRAVRPGSLPATPVAVRERGPSPAQPAGDRGESAHAAQARQASLLPQQARL
ncbi:hypothetical protein PVAP13_4KG023716 [Panicum virgatum]|uniref:Uncharacterized protein n=1 Tax=Panicum virgatum TaxID=38727 RepID=A0A8T0TJL7_PANVG|nr:hypothetical protein PVAP13_4KG023716 [Panicum virgatum]